MKIITTINDLGEIEVQNFYSDTYEVTTIVGNELPQRPEIIGVGKDLKLMYDAETESLYWKEVDRPLTAEEESMLLKEKVQLMQAALDELILRGAL